MKTLELSQMERLQGGSNAEAIVCGIGIGLLFTPLAFWGALVVTTCLIGDSNPK